MSENIKKIRNTNGLPEDMSEPSAAALTETEVNGYEEKGGVGDEEITPLPADYTGTGYLTVSVRAAEGAIPLQNAIVVIRPGTSVTPASDDDIIAAFATDRSGLTPRIYLPAPPRSYSDSPGGPRAYAEYSVEVSKEGYGSNVYTDIPVFDGINSVQTAILIPLPENFSEGTGGIDSVNSFGGGRDGGPDSTGGIR